MLKLYYYIIVKMEMLSQLTKENDYSFCIKYIV